MDLSPRTVVRVSGPVVEVEGMGDARLLDLVELGPRRLVGEVISLRGELAVAQAHEYTGGLAPGAPAWLGSGPLSADLGPGLLGGVFDGMLRRLTDVGERSTPGTHAPTLQADRVWRFTPRVGAGDRIGGGAVLGVVPETEAIQTRVLAPPDVAGRIDWVAPEGDYTVSEPIATVDDRQLRLAHTWPLRHPRPSRLRV
ncbi:MAG: V-type ATP synthase subunit A, partial [Solirubrobacteraceae bacterium]